MNKKKLSGLLLLIISILLIGCSDVEKAANENDTEFSNTISEKFHETAKQNDLLQSVNLSNSALTDMVLEATFCDFPPNNTLVQAKFQNSTRLVTIKRNSLLMGPDVLLTSSTSQKVADKKISFYDAITAENSSSSQLYYFGIGENETGDNEAIMYYEDPRNLDYFFLSEESQRKDLLSVSDLKGNSKKILISRDVFTGELLDKLRKTELDLDKIKAQYIYSIWPVYFKPSLLLYDGDKEYLLMLDEGGLEYHHAVLMEAESIYEDFPRLPDNDQYLIYYHKGDLLNIQDDFISDLTKVLEHYEK